MISIAIFNDQENNSTAVLCSKIQDWLIETKTMAKVSTFTNEQEIVDIPASFDIYIMDMESNTDVVQLSKKILDIDVNSHIAFIGHDFKKALKMHGSFYLPKPIKYEELCAVLGKIKKAVREDNIIIKTPQGDRRVKTNMVNFIHIEKRCLCYHLKDGAIFDGQTLRESFEKAIGPLKNHPTFLFVSPSLVLNLNEIKILDTDCITFEDGEMLYFPKRAHDYIYNKWKTYNLT